METISLSIPFGILRNAVGGTGNEAMMTFNSFWDSTTWTTGELDVTETSFQFLLGFYFSCRNKGNLGEILSIPFGILLKGKLRLHVVGTSPSFQFLLGFYSITYLATKFG